MTDTPRVTQQMVDLYDAYTHVTLDRRGLMSGLARLAGGTTAALAVLPLIEANAAQAAIIADDDARLVSEMVEWPGAGGVTMKGYLVRLAGRAKRRPAVIVIHENRGLTPHIRDVARRTALAGFTALAPDFLSPSGGTPSDEDAARAAIGKLDRPAAIANAVATVAFLRSHKLSTGKLGAVGFCWGGGMTNQLAVAAGKNLKAAVPFYGPAPEPAAVPAIKAAVQAHYAGLDTRINAGIPAFEAALKAAGTRHEIHIYDGVNHAFHNDGSAARYDKTAADLAWGRTIDWFKAKLRDQTANFPNVELS